MSEEDIVAEYRFVIYRDGDDYVAKCISMPGLIGVSDTEFSALDVAVSFMSAWKELKDNGFKRTP